MRSIYVVLHGETVFSRAGRLQGSRAHTPLTLLGLQQAGTVAAKLAICLPPGSLFEIHSSTSGRALQTAAIVAERLGRAYDDVRADDRLMEIDVGAWAGKLVAEIENMEGSVVDQEGLFVRRPPGGEWFDDVARRVKSWLVNLEGDATVIVVTHRITSRVLRGLCSNNGSPHDFQLGPDQARDEVTRAE